MVRGADLMRRCELCGVELRHRRDDCRYCSGACRAAASRLRLQESVGIDRSFWAALESTRAKESARSRTCAARASVALPAITADPDATELT